MTTISQPQSDVTSYAVPSSADSIAAQVKLSVTIASPEDTVDLAGELRLLVAGAGVADGTLHIYCGHTTCGLIANENESGLDVDMKGVLERVAPHSDHHYYAHDKMRTPDERLVHGERDNGHSHIRALVSTHPELHIPITGGELYLGRWQTIRLAEFDGPAPENCSYASTAPDPRMACDLDAAQASVRGVISPGGLAARSVSQGPGAVHFRGLHGIWGQPGDHA